MKNAHDFVNAAKSRVHEVPLGEAEQAISAPTCSRRARELMNLQPDTCRGALHVSRGLLEFKLSGTPALTARDLKVVVYCKTSGRAALAAAVMQDMGYLDVVSIAGGFDAWVAAGKPVVRPNSRLSIERIVVRLARRDPERVLTGSDMSIDRAAATRHR